MSRSVSLHLLGSLCGGAGVFTASVAGFLLLSIMDGAATMPPDPVAQQAAFLAGDGVKVLYRPQAARARAFPQAKPVTAETAAIVVGRTEAELVARLGYPSREQAAAPGKILRYDGAGCTVEIHLFPDTRGGMRALDVLTDGAADCLR